MKIVSILIGKILIFIGSLLHRGSVLPGKVALKLDKNIFKKFVLPKMVIAVTGSSGKGSTTKMIADVYKSLGYKVAYNYKGSNLRLGILTLLIENSNLFGKIKKDVLLFEIDERYTKFVFKDIVPMYVVVTNITRDQPPRQGHFDLVFNDILSSITSDMHLILNADDPYLAKFNIDNKYKVTYYGISKNKYSYLNPKFDSLNMTHCPICHNKLKYNFYHIEDLGDYYCSKNHFQRPKPDYEVTNLDYDNSLITINKKYKVHIPQDVLFCVYNTLATFSLFGNLNIDLNKVSDVISNMSSNKKIYNQYKYKDRLVYVLNNKNENATTFNQSLLFTDRSKNLKTIVIGWKEISRRYNFDDLSWLYDINFELLNNDSVDKIVCVGIHAYDIATRLKYANIDKKKIVCFSSLEEAINTIKNKTKGNIYGILNFDYVKPFNDLMNEGGKNDD